MANINSSQENFVYLKVHSTTGGNLYAFADPEIIGKTFSNGRARIAVSEDFYKGKLIPMEDALGIIKKHYNSNIVGSLAIIAVKKGIVHPHSILWIKDKDTGEKIAHLLLLRV